MKNFQFLLVTGFVTSILTISIMAQENPNPPAATPPNASPSTPAPTTPALRDLSPISIIRLFYKDELLQQYFSVSQEQIDKLEKVFAELEQDARALQANYTGQQLTPEMAERHQKEIFEIQQKLINVFKDTLSPEQLKKFNSIRFQILGGFDSPLANVELLQIFDLTPEQVTKIDELVKERQKKILTVAGILRERPVSQEQARERVMQVRREGIEISREYGRKIRELLTEKQLQEAAVLEKNADEIRQKLRLNLPNPSRQFPAAPVAGQN